MYGDAGSVRDSRSADHRTSPSSSAPRCTVPASATSACAPGDRAVERPVDLDDRGVPLEVVQVAQQAGRHGVGRQQVPVQQRRVDVGDHGAAHPHGQPGRGVHGDGPAAAHVDPLHGLPAVHRRSGCPCAPLQRRGQLARAPHRHREPVLLAEHRQQPAEGPADRCVDRRVRVRGVAREQQPGTFAREQFLAHPLRRQQEEPGEAQRFGRADRPQQRHRAADRRERREERAQHRVADRVPLPAQLEPRVAVARVLLGQARCRRLPVAEQERGAFRRRVAGDGRAPPGRATRAARAPPDPAPAGPATPRRGGRTPRTGPR